MSTLTDTILGSMSAEFSAVLEPCPSKVAAEALSATEGFPLKAEKKVADAAKKMGATAARETVDDVFKKYAVLIQNYGPVFRDEGKGRIVLNQAFFAARFRQEHELLFSREEEEFYFYEPKTGLWENKSERSVRKMILQDAVAFSRKLGMHGQIPVKLTDGQVDDIAKWLAAFSEESNPFPVSDKIHCLDGVYSIRSGKLVPEAFSPAHRSRSGFRYAYDPKAKCERFLKELLAPALSPEDIDLMQRWAGSVILGGNRAQRILVVTGTAGGGKSTLLSVLESVIGRENVVELRVDALDKQFEKSRFIGKRLLVGKDVRSDYLSDKSVSGLKSLTGGDMLTAERKYSNEVFEFEGNFAIAVTSNAILRLKLDDDADAWRRRLLAITFEQPPAGKPVPGFAQKLIQEEGAGIFRWMLDGAIKHLSELEAVGNYRLTAKQLDRVDAIIGQSDGVDCFLRDAVESHGGWDLSVEELLTAYSEYCVARGWTPIADRTFCIEVEKKMGRRFSAHKSHDIPRNGRQVRGYKDVRLIPRRGATEATQAPAPALNAVQRHEELEVVRKFEEDLTF